MKLEDFLYFLYLDLNSLSIILKVLLWTDCYLEKGLRNWCQAELHSAGSVQILFYSTEKDVKILYQMQILHQMWIGSNYFGSTQECHVSHFAFYMGTSWTLLLSPASTAMALYDRKDSDSHHFPVWNRSFFFAFLIAVSGQSCHSSFILESEFVCQVGLVLLFIYTFYVFVFCCYS